MSKPLTSPQIVPVPASLRLQALQLLWAHLDTDTRGRLIGSFEKEAISYGESYWSGLLGLFDARELAGVAWLQFHQGRAASLHGPVLLAYNHDLAVQFVRSALCSEDATRACIAQTLLQNSQDPPAMALVQAGFAHAADLDYLFRRIDTQPAGQPATRLQFEPYSPKNNDRLRSVIEQTYIGSQDCPMVDGVRSVEDVLAGYQATGAFRSDFWQLVSWDNGGYQPAEDVGCLLLADQPTTEQIELVYMGVVPEHRGKGFGQEIIARAIQIAAEAGRSRIVLAVDTANRPGLAIYEAAGFRVFDQRSLFLFVFSRGS